jgi:antitoxin component YwqK of YwqJK toxin-antitoxin module
MEKRILLIITISLSTLFLKASCFDDEKNWSEKIFKGDYRLTVFTCKILEFSAEKAQMTTIGYDGLKAIAQIDKIFLGKIDTTIVYLSPYSYLVAGETYLVYGSGKGNHFFFGGMCDFLSKRVTNSKDVLQELKTLSEISDIENNRLTCYHTMQDANNKILAEGFYENGKPVKIWKHYWQNGNMKAEYDFTNKSEIQYRENGLKKYKIGWFENEQTYCQYSTKNNEFLENKHIMKKTEYGELVTWFSYYDNGNLQEQYSEKSFGNHKSGYSYSGEKFDYQEYYDNGKIKAKGSFFEKDSVGTWYFYDEKGNYKEKKDYKNTDTLRLIAREKEEIEKNSVTLCELCVSVLKK